VFPNYTSGIALSQLIPAILPTVRHLSLNSSVYIGHLIYVYRSSYQPNVWNIIIVTSSYCYLFNTSSDDGLGGEMRSLRFWEAQENNLV
jgi:hypothetical protein